jgi:hypothetical protein
MIPDFSASQNEKLLAHNSTSASIRTSQLLLDWMTPTSVLIGYDL